MHPQDIVSNLVTKENFIFSFDFGTLCGKLHAGGPQAAYPSVKGVAASTPPARKWTNWTRSCRAAQNCTVSNPIAAPRWDIARARQIGGLRLQARPNAQAADKSGAQKGSFGIRRAQMAVVAAPAFFQPLAQRTIVPLIAPQQRSLARKRAYAALNPPLSARALCDSTAPAQAGHVLRRQRGQIC